MIYAKYIHLMHEVIDAKILRVYKKVQRIKSYDNNKQKYRNTSS